MKDRFTNVLFDLDGTLTDPAPGITGAAAYALRHFGIEIKELSELNWIIGPPLMRSFEEGFDMTPEQARAALNKYREYFSEKGLYENQIYPGIAQLLSELKAAGHRVILATSKPEEFAQRILQHFGILQYFDFVGGNTLDEERPTKSDVIAHILKTMPDITPDNSIMVGDRKYDIEGAGEFGIGCIGVLYGYGDYGELMDADYVVSTVEGLKNILL